MSSLSAETWSSVIMIFFFSAASGFFQFQVSRLVNGAWNASKELILQRDPLGHEKRRCEENTTACRAVERRVRDRQPLKGWKWGRNFDHQTCDLQKLGK